MSNDYRMPRGWMNHPALGGTREVFCRRAAFAWLVEEARYTDQQKPDGLGQTTLKRGQVGHSLRFMAKAWGWDDAKVRRFLSKIKDANLIDCVVDAGQTVVTIRNYSVFSPNGRVSDAPIDAVTTQQQRSSDANLKEGNTEERKEDSPPSPPLGGSRDLFSEGSGAPAKSGKTTKKPKKDASFQPWMMEDWQKFMAVYPDRGSVNPQVAGREAFARALLKGANAEELIAAAKAYDAEAIRSNKIGTESVKHYATFLSPKEDYWKQCLEREAKNAQGNVHPLRPNQSRFGNDHQSHGPKLRGIIG